MRALGSFLLNDCSLSLKNVFSAREGFVRPLKEMPERDICDVDSNSGIGMTACELFRNGGSPVTAVRPERFVAEFIFCQARPSRPTRNIASGFASLSEKP
jgi:hypothetical protein